MRVAGGKRYRMEKVVGNGAFGIVWRAREEGSSGGPVAIKKVILDRRYHNRELEMMKGMEHECANATPSPSPNPSSGHSPGPSQASLL